MRWQRLSISECVRVGGWRAAWSRMAPPLVLSGCLLAGAILVLTPTPAPAEGDEVVEGGAEIFTAGDGPERGMPASNSRVKSILASHPNDFVTICVAGCDGNSTIVQTLPKPAAKRIAGMRTTSGAEPGARWPAYDAVDSDAVLCVAGCEGKAGQVLQRLPGLPPPKVAPRQPDGQGNEPLDVH